MIHDDPALLPRHEMSPESRSRTRGFVLAHLADGAGQATSRVVTSRRGLPADRSWRRWAGAATAVAAGAALILAGTLFLAGPGASPAWAAEPDQLTGADLQSARSHCDSALRGVPGRGMPQTVSAVVAEQRGATSSILIASPTSLGVCIGATNARLNGIIQLSPLNPGTSLSVDGQPGAMNLESPTRVVVGRVSGVAPTVTVVTTDGRHVTASVQSGYYLAWWPSGADAVSINAVDADGALIGQVAPEAINPNGQPPAPQRAP